MSNIDKSSNTSKKVARPRSKKIQAAALTGLVSTCYSSLALALPTGEVVVNNGAGSVTFDRSTANTLNINQSANKAIINWSNFDINQNELVKFIQSAGNNAVTLNKINGNSVTQISGALQANGNLFLINPAGIVFNGTASVNVNGLLATTLDVNNNDFMNGAASFTGAANSTSSVKNLGEIKAGGAVYLIAPEVSNEGTITGTAVASRVGKVVLGAGDKFDVQFDSSNLIGFQINNLQQAATTTTTNSVKNSQTGLIQAENVYMSAAQTAALESSVVNNSGVVEATSLIDISAGTIQQDGALLKTNIIPIDFKTTTINLKASDSIVTGANSKTAASTLNLETTKAEAGIGGTVGVNDGSDTTPVSFDADLVNAKTNKGNIYLKDTAGGVTLGTVDTGANLPAATANFKTAIIANAVGGAIRASNNSNDIHRAFSINLTADGDIGTTATPFKTDTSYLAAYAKDGGINISNSSFDASASPLALILGAIKTTQISNGIALTAVDDGNGNIRLVDGSQGTKDIIINTVGNLVLTDTINATRNLSLNAGGAIQTSGRLTNGVMVLPTLTAVKFSATAAGDIGLAAQAIKTNIENVTANTTNGGVFLSEQNGLRRADITATKDISLNADTGDIVLGALTTQKQQTNNSVTTATKATVSSKKGAILAATTNPAATNIQAGELDISTLSSIGTANNNIKTNVDRVKLSNTSTVSSVSSHINNASALKSIDASVRGTNALVKFANNGQLSFDATTGKLKLVGGLGETLNFTNDSSAAATQNIVLDGITLGSEQKLTLSATGSVNQSGTTPTIAKEITITAGKGIGTNQALSTQTKKATLTSTSGNIQLSNSSSDLEVNAKATGANAEISIDQTGNLLVANAQGAGKITLHANNGTLTDTSSATIKGTALDAKATAIGSTNNPFNTQIQGSDVQLIATNGDINFNNTGNITGTGLNASTTGNLTITSNANVAFGTLSSKGKMVITIAGDGTDANGATANFVVNNPEGLRYAAKSMGTESDKLELQVSKLVVDTTSGGIYAVNSNGTDFNLVHAVASGAGSNINIETDKNLNLGVVETRGNTVTLKSGGAIEDARKSGETSPNVKAKALDISAAAGVGANGDLALDVNYIAATGGNSAVKANNLSAIALDYETLSNKSVTISASDIIILDNGGRVINLQEGGTLNLTATGGNIVFLNQKDTLAVGSGNISFVANYASSDRGYSGAIVTGNLTTTNGGNINVEAASNITIGMLDAGNTGNVTVNAHNGIIIDGNGAAQNIRGNVVTLSAKTPDQNTAEINRETAISELSAKEALVSSLTTLKKNNEETVQSTTNAESLAQRNLTLADILQKMTEQEFDEKSEEADNYRNFYDDLMTAYNLAKVISDASGLVSSGAQAVPLAGDGGAEATTSGFEVATAIAEFAADEYDKRYLGPKEDEVTELRVVLAEYNANLKSAESDLAYAEIYRQSAEANLATTTEDLIKATQARDASLQIRRQALTAYDLNKDIDSSATKPLGITANRLDINDGGTLNTSLYLDSTGDIGLGNIQLKAGDDLIVKAAGSVNQVGTVKVISDLSNSASINRGLISIESNGGVKNLAVNTDGVFIADDLVIKAKDGVGVDRTINTQIENLSVDGGKGVNIINQTNAPLNVTRIGTVVGISGDGDISLKTNGDLVLKEIVKDTNLSSKNTTHLTSVNGSLVDSNLSGLNVQSSELIADAHHDINLDTQVDGLIAHTDTSGQGHLQIREVDNLNIHEVNVGNGNIDILASNMVVEKMKAQDSDLSDSRDVGNILLKARNNSYVRDDGDNSTLIEGKKLTIDAGADIGGNTNQSTATRSLDTNVDEVVINAKGVVNVAEVNNLKVSSIQTTGDVTVQSLTGDLNIGKIVTNTNINQPTTVTLFAKEGAVINDLAKDANQVTVEPNIVANRLAAKAKNGVGTSSNNMNVRIDRVEAETEKGGIYLTDQTGNLEVADVKSGLDLDTLNGLNVANTGDISLTVEQGSLEQTNQVSTLAGNIAFAVKNNVNIGQQLKTSLGSVQVKAETGSITTEADAPISAQGQDAINGNISLTAATGIRQNANVVSQGYGDIGYKSATGDIVQNANTSTTQGNIDYTADAGSINMTELRSTSTGQGKVTYTAGTDINSQIVKSNAGNIALTANRDVVIGNETTTGLGQVAITATTGSITTEADAPISAQGQDAVNGNISLTAATGIRQNANVVSQGYGDIGYKSATGDIVQNANTSTTQGNIDYTADAGSINMTELRSTSTGQGKVTYIAGTDINSQIVKSNAGNIALTANRDVVIGNETTTGLGQVAITATTGSITTEADAPISAQGQDAVNGNISLTAATGIRQNANVVSQGYGDIGYKSATGDIVQNANTSTTQGNIDYTADAGSINMTELRSTTTGQGKVTYTAGTDINSQIVKSNAGNIALTANRDVVIGNETTTGLGQVAITAKTGSITTEADAPISAQGQDAINGNISLTAATGIRQNANVVSQGYGDIGYKSATGDIVQNANTSTTQGNIDYTADAGSINMETGTLTSVVQKGNVQYKAKQDIVVNRIETPNSNQVSLISEDGRVSVQANTPADTNVVTGDLVVSAKKNIASLVLPLKTKITRLFARTTGNDSSYASDIYINEQDGIELSQVQTQNGQFVLNAGQNILAKDVSINGDMSVKTHGQFTTYVPITATEIAGSVKANQLKVSADQLVDLNTQVNNADITLKNGGDININEKDNITLSQLSTPNGNINVKANGAIAVDKVTATAQVKLASLNADIKRLASSQADKNIVSQDLSLVSATGIGLSTLPLSIQTNTLSAAATSGDIYLTQQGNLNLKNLTTPANVQLTIKNGGLTGSATGTLKASQAKIDAEGAVTNLNTAVDRLNISTTQGNITVHEADGLSRVDAKTKNGNIELDTRTGDIGLGLIQAADLPSTTTATRLGNVTITAAQGAIKDADNDDDNLRLLNVVGKSFVASATQGVGEPNNSLEIDVTNLTANTGTGGIALVKLNSTDLNLVAAKGQPSLSAQSGDISIKTAGRLNIENPIYQANNGNINLNAQGDINQNADITTHANGNINVISGGNINMLTNNTQSDGVRTTTGSGVITYQAADTLNLGYLQSTEFGGGVKITAAKINDGITTGGNIEGSFIDIKSPSMNPALVEQLIAEKILESALIKLNYQVIGGSLSNSRKFMSDLFVSEQQLANSLKFDSKVGLNELVNIDLLK